MTSALIVDDSAMDRALAAALLQQQLQIAVVTAENGEEALRCFERHVPDIVVTDLVMPGMNGLELIETVKERYPLTPVVMMTSRGSEEIAVEALERGAASYVPKRILSRRLPETVDRILQAAREEKNQARLLQRLVNDECAFVLENDLTLICTLVAFLRQGLRGVGLCEESEHMRIGVALEEALLNAYYHGNLEVDSALREQDDDEFRELARQRISEPPYCDRRIHFHAKYSEAEAVFVIRDDGHGFDTSRIPDPTEPENMLRASGRGLLLMRAFMDELRFNESGNEVTLVKRPGDNRRAGTQLAVRHTARGGA